MAQIFIEFTVQTTKPDSSFGFRIRALRRGVSMEKPMEAILMHDIEDEELSELDSARKARVGGRVRHPKTTAFGEGQREENPDDRRAKIVVHFERVVLDDPDTEVGSGEPGVGRSWENAYGDVQVFSRV